MEVILVGAIQVGILTIVIRVNDITLQQIETMEEINIYQLFRTFNEHYMFGLSVCIMMELYVYWFYQYFNIELKLV